jgi:hypothetical protein
MINNSLSRRDFVKTASLAATAVTTGLGLEPMSRARRRSSGRAAKPMIGFQVEVTYLLQYGIARFLDDVQTRASVNTLMLHGNPFEASWAGLDRAANPAGNFATAHPQYYRDIKMQAQALARATSTFPTRCRRSPPKPKNAASRSSPGWRRTIARARDQGHGRAL